MAKITHKMAKITHKQAIVLARALDTAQPGDVNDVAEQLFWAMCDAGVQGDIATADEIAQQVARAGEVETAEAYYGRTWARDGRRRITVSIPKA